LHESALKKSCAQRPSRRIRIPSELSSRRTLATPLMRTTSAKALDLSEAICNHQTPRDGRLAKQIELIVKHATPPRYIMLCYVYTNTRTCTANHAPLSTLLHFSCFPLTLFQKWASQTYSPETRNLHRIHAPAIPGTVHKGGKGGKGGAREVGDSTIVSFTFMFMFMFMFMCELD
jgi:hypothetical protein